MSSPDRAGPPLARRALLLAGAVLAVSWRACSGRRG